MTSKKCAILMVVSILNIMAILALLGCSALDSNRNRALKSITLSPATADAQNFPGGQVQFTATGNFSQPPSPAPLSFKAPYTGGWHTSDPAIANINQDGVAECTSDTAGAVTVTAMASANSCTTPGCMSIAVLGTASLTCP